MPNIPARPRAVARSLTGWLDNHAYRAEERDGIDWLRVLPFIGLHVACLAAFWTGVSATALIVLAASFTLRMLAVTAFYHRYFSHRAYRVARVTQFLMAVAGATATQRGPLWWASHHRAHHRHADRPGDPHSPRDGFWHSHMGWFLQARNFPTRLALVRDLGKFPELVWLDRFDVAVPVAYAASLYLLGEWLAASFGIATSGAQLLVFGYVIATVALFHATFCINSLAHRLGRRDFETPEDSRNNGWLALLTFGEGWHNNHHRFPSSVRQGLRWWQWDPSWWLIAAMEKCGLAWGLKRPPQGALQ